jgi:hypothetical protein
VPHGNVFFELLKSRKNRMVWGATIALSCVAVADPDVIWQRHADLVGVFDGGSVITRDHVVRALALVAKSSSSRQRKLSPWLLRALETVRPVNLPRWAEDILPVLDGRSGERAGELLEARLGELGTSSRQRLARLLRAR